MEAEQPFDAAARALGERCRRPPRAVDPNGAPYWPSSRPLKTHATLRLDTASPRDAASPRTPAASPLDARRPATLAVWPSQAVLQTTKFALQRALLCIYPGQFHRWRARPTTTHGPRPRSSHASALEHHRNRVHLTNRDARPLPR